MRSANSNHTSNQQSRQKAARILSVLIAAVCLIATSCSASDSTPDGIAPLLEKMQVQNVDVVQKPLGL